MSTRAATASVSLRAKQELVKLLFGSTYQRKGYDAHRMLDYTIYSFHDLKKAYLERVQQLHPDKCRYSTNHDTENNFVSKKQHQTAAHDKCSVSSDRTDFIDDKSGTHHDFIKLQEAWEAYAVIAKMMKTVGHDDPHHHQREANFTMFGVGCSFADNDKERELRTEFMDLAARGWLPSGALGTGSSCTTGSQTGKRLSSSSSCASNVRLTSDDQFVAIGHDTETTDSFVTTTTSGSTNKIEKKGNTTKSTSAYTRASLVRHLIPPHKRT